MDAYEFVCWWSNRWGVGERDDDLLVGDHLVFYPVGVFAIKEKGKKGERG